MSHLRFEHDRVEEWDPRSFALEFTRRMRRIKRLSHKPSLRTTLAIPSLLSAHYFRVGMLLPVDYIRAAVLTTVPDDQDIANEVARELIFPRRSDTGSGESGVPVTVAAEVPDDDPMAGILADLADLDLDLDAVDSLDEALDEAPTDVGSFDLFEDLYSSADIAERALAELVVVFGGPAELVADDVRTTGQLRLFVRDRLLAQVGALRPELVVHACHAGLAKEIVPAVEDPWELAGFLAGEGRWAALEALLTDVLASHDVRAQGRTLSFLRAHEDRLERVDLHDFARRALAHVRDLAGFGELVIGIDTWLDPPADLLTRSVEDNVRRALVAAKSLDSAFGRGLSDEVLRVWVEQLDGPPQLDDLIELYVDSGHWLALTRDALEHHVARLRAVAAATRAEDPRAIALPDLLIDAAHLARRLSQVPSGEAEHMAEALSTETLTVLFCAPQFLPMLDAFLEGHVIPSDIPRVIRHGESLGVDPDDIRDRIGNALTQLCDMCRNGERDADRYRRVVERVSGMPEELMEECMAIAIAGRNLEAMAALLAVDLGGAAARMTEAQVMSSLGYKGIGGGDNLLKQWFTHRGRIADGLRQRIKEVAREALLDAAFRWIGKGDGSGEQGLIPQSRSRPFNAGDDLDALDLESTLEGLLADGRRLDEIRADDLRVKDTSRGRAALAVLIDISGSMSGPDLAICAVATLMLLGKVRSDEIALAVFESNTHVIKNLDDPTDLDEVADQILDLEATGGTRVDAALRWAEEQLGGAQAADLRLLFLLSDFAFFEPPDELRKAAQRLADLGAVFLGASHGYVDRSTLRTLEDTIGGRSISLSSMKKLPETLLATLQEIGE